MAERDDDHEGQKPNGDGGEEQLPDDPNELKKLLAQTRSQLGRITREAKQTKQARAELADHLSKWSKIAEKHNLDPDTLERTLTERDERDLQRAKDAGGEEAQQMIENLRQKHARELAAMKEELEKERIRLQGVLVDDRLSVALAKYVDTGKPGLMDGAFALLRPKVKAVPDPESPRGYSPAVNVDGADMPLDEFLEQWADTDPKAQPYLKPSQATGGDARGGAGGRPAKQLYRRDMTAKQMSDFINAHGGGATGLAAFKALPHEPPTGVSR